MIPNDLLSFKIEDITFIFRNKYKYSDYRDNLYSLITKYIKQLESINKEEIDYHARVKEQLKRCDYTIYISLTDPLEIEKENKKFIYYGRSGKLKDTNEFLIILYLFPKKTRECIYKEIQHFELFKTFIHEYYHLFYEIDEQMVRTKTDSFLYKIFPNYSLYNSIIKPSDKNSIASFYKK